MPQQRPFTQIDVFTARPYLGNPLAVVLDGTGLSDAAMQDFARWTNLSETTFVLPPTPAAAAAGADYQVRIFTPAGELPFAGHPTLGTCHAWLEHGGVPRASRGGTDAAALIVQECPVGLVQIRRSGKRLAFAAPALKRSNPSPVLLAQVAAALGLQARHIVAAQQLNNGATCLGLLLDSQQTVLQLKPDPRALQGLVPGVGVAHVEYGDDASNLIARSNREARAFGARSSASPTPPQAEPSVEVRFFSTDLGATEDPVTGSFNASLAQWLIADGHAPAHYVAAQGTCIGREGRVYIDQDAAGQVWVGGDAVSCIRGEVLL